MKKVLLFAALAAALLASMLTAGSAAAAAGTSVTIDPQAQYDFFGMDVAVRLIARCQGGSGFVTVTVTQTATEAPPAGASGTGSNTVVCDGRQHEVGVTVLTEGPSPFDVGEGVATASLTGGDGGTDTATKKIHITPV